MSNLAWGGFSNGRIPGTQMLAVPNFSPLGGQNASAGAQSNMMRADAARQLSGLMQAFYRARKKILRLSEGFRSDDTQGWYYNRYMHKLPGWTLAAFPGTSIHGWGLSADLNINGGNPSGDDLAWLRANAGKYGFVNDVSTEVWHWSYRTDLVRASVVISKLIADPQAADGAPAKEAPKNLNLENDMPRLIRIEQPDNKAVHGGVYMMFVDRQTPITSAKHAYNLLRAWGMITPTDPARALGFAENINYEEFLAAKKDIEDHRSGIQAQIVEKVWAGDLGGHPAYSYMIDNGRIKAALGDAAKTDLVSSIKAALPASVGGSGSVDLNALAEAVADKLAKRLQS